MKTNYVGLPHHKTDDWCGSLAWSSNSDQTTQKEMNDLRQLYDAALNGNVSALHELVLKARSDAELEAQYEG